MFHPILDQGEGSTRLICFDKDYENLEDSPCCQMLFLDVKEDKLKPINVYPNPANDNLFFEVEKAGEKYQLTITNRPGRFWAFDPDCHIYT